MKSDDLESHAPWIFILRGEDRELWSQNFGQCKDYIVVAKG